MKQVVGWRGFDIFKNSPDLKIPYPLIGRMEPRSTRPESEFTCPMFPFHHTEQPSLTIRTL